MPLGHPLQLLLLAMVPLLRLRLPHLRQRQHVLQHLLLHLHLLQRQELLHPHRHQPPLLPRK